MMATVPQRHICFGVSQARLPASGLLMCKSTLRRPLPRICGSSKVALLNSYVLLFTILSVFGLDGYMMKILFC